MKVNGQGVSPAVATQLNADNAINFAATAKMIAELNNQDVPSIIAPGTPDDNATIISLYTKSMASRIALTKFKWD
ncbi:hypothetical protein [Pseudoalteromonas sp.]|jgi:dihydrodipicolinate synthase/N-acetylneuraminate lyase|uniref:hypothetical protein n=1 Tax=Pseudoalteromonas sp. TaxID=53249 RepID=UPI003565EE1D